MKKWDKTELMQNIQLETLSFKKITLLDMEILIGILGMPTQIVTFNETGKYDPWNREWEEGTAWTSYDAYKDVLFRWVTVDGKQAPVYCVMRS